ncbi:MAG TPA: SIS domain-containing protein [Acidobacteriaceae bacterium]
MSVPEFAHAMLREIHEQPQALERLLAAYLAGDAFKPAIFDPLAEWFSAASQLVIVASGSSRHAGLAAEIMFEDRTGMAVDVEYASEYSYRRSNTTPDAAVLVISQSGETADTLAALRAAAARGHRTMAVTNVPDSTMMREAQHALSTEAGVELAIPATKSFLNQLALLNLLSLAAAQARGTMTRAEVARQLTLMRAVPAQVAAGLDPWARRAQACAAAFDDAKTFLFLGRGVHYPIAREGALKLKESSYVHAEGYPSGEVLHGPNALVSDAVPLVVLASYDPRLEESEARYARTLHLLGILRGQGARVMATANAGDRQVAEVAEQVIEVPPAEEHLLPLLEVIPLQLFAYYLAVQKGVDVDRPRNLVKSVPVG